MAVVGIDLGTTNTVVGIVQNGQATAIRDGDGEYLIPSVVSFHSNGTVLVGRPAKERRVVDATNTIYSIKRLIGRSWNSAEVARARSRFPFEMREGPGQAALVVARGETFTLPEISAFVLRHAKALAEKTLGEPVDRAVITVPANFNDLQRAATKVAGRVAGLEVLRILNEPTAAALAYGYGRSKGERIAIYDFGGGTFDVTLLDLSGNVFEVLATAGNTFLGGDDIDLAIAEKMAEACTKQHRIDAHADPQVFERLRYYAEKLKVELSTSMTATIDVPDVGVAPGGKPIRLSFSMSRVELEALAKPIVERTFEVCQDALGVARLSPDNFDQVVLVGGSTRLPIVRARVEEYFGRAPLDRINPDEVVAIGAAIQANALTGAERRRSTIPRPPMPAARSLEESVATQLPRGKSQPPPHPHTRPGSRGKTDPFGKIPVPLHAAPRAAATSPEPGARRRVTTGMGLGQPPPVHVPEERKPPLPRKGGTLGGVGTPSRLRGTPERPPDSAPTQRSSERPSVDEAWDLGHARRSSRPPTDAESTPLAVVTAATAAASGATHSAGADLALDDELTSVKPSAPSPSPSDDEFSFGDDEATYVGAPPEVVAQARAMFAHQDEPDAGVLSPYGSVELEPKTEVDAARPNARPAPPVTAPAAPLSRETSRHDPIAIRAAPEPQRPMRGFQTTMLGGAGGGAPGAVGGGPPPLRESPPVREPPPMSFRDTALAAPGTVAHLPPSAPAPFSTTKPESRQLDLSDEPVRRPVVPLLVDVTPLSLCVETVGGYRDVIIERNTPVPCEQSRAFVTARDNQEVVLVRVGQGEESRFADNVVLGELELSGLRAAARGEAQFVVTFTLDTDGMLEVRARDPDTGSAASAKLRLVGLPDPAEVGRMARRHLQHPAP